MVCVQRKTSRSVKEYSNGFLFCHKKFIDFPSKRFYCVQTRRRESWFAELVPLQLNSIVYFDVLLASQSALHSVGSGLFYIFIFTYKRFSIIHAKIIFSARNSWTMSSKKYNIFVYDYIIITYYKVQLFHKISKYFTNHPIKFIYPVYKTVDIKILYSMK